MSTDGLKWGDSPAGRQGSGPAAARSAARRREAEERVLTVEAVRTAVAAGTYQVDSTVIAERMLERHVFEDEES